MKPLLPKPSLILLHGFGMHKAVFDHWLPYLNSAFNVKALDLPGFGARNQEAFFNLEEVAQFLNEEIQEPAIIAGWSFGGLAALQYAAIYPQKVSHLVLIASTPYFRNSAHWQGGIQEKALIQFRSQFLNNPQQTLYDFIELQLRAAPLEQSEKQQLYEACVAMLPSIATSNTILHLLESHDLRQEFSKITCPILSLFGEKDRLIHPLAKEALLQLKTHESAIIKSATHPLFLSHPKEAATLLIQFIEKNNVI